MEAGRQRLTTYTYSKGSEGQADRLSNFKEAGHVNPGHWRFEGNTLNAAKVTAGAFTLDASLIGKIDNYTPVDPAGDAVEGFPDDLKSDAVYSNNATLFPTMPARNPTPTRRGSAI